MPKKAKGPPSDGGGGEGRAPNWSPLENAAAALASIAATEKVQHQNDRALDTQATEGFAFCLQELHDDPDYGPFVQRRWKQQVWDLQKAKEVRTLAGGVHHRWKNYVRPALLNFFQPAFYKACPGKVPKSGLQKQDIIRKVKYAWCCAP